MVNDVEVSENKEALIVLAGTAAGATTTFIAALLIPAEIKIPIVTFVGSISAAIQLYWKNKGNKNKNSLFSFFCFYKIILPIKQLG